MAECNGVCKGPFEYSTQFSILPRTERRSLNKKAVWLLLVVVVALRSKPSSLATPATNLCLGSPCVVESQTRSRMPYEGRSC